MNENEKSSNETQEEKKPKRKVKTLDERIRDIDEKIKKLQDNRKKIMDRKESEDTKLVKNTLNEMDMTIEEAVNILKKTQLNKITERLEPLNENVEKNIYFQKAFQYCFVINTLNVLCYVH